VPHQPRDRRHRVRRDNPREGVVCITATTAIRLRGATSKGGWTREPQVSRHAR